MQLKIIEGCRLPVKRDLEGQSEWRKNFLVAFIFYIYCNFLNCLHIHIEFSVLIIFV